ncbi:MULTISPECIES: hypothetical protein [Methylocaldum]|jgi:hypothetical protein|uniref:hypothetical protein n=1 Tax=unclassified Methylocaldum TaxID=2622260 RepID=UPI000989DE11|nr:hypothetical protein [Methylocaldum sp. 14B]MVF21442.1 hypothetical protein [Methylocaldum sp. BRCS4]
MTDFAIAPLRLAVLGMDERTAKLFKMFLHGPCRNQAEIVGDGEEAEACMIDMDAQRAAELLDRERQTHPDRVLILLSLNDRASSPETVFLKKPVQAESMLQAIRRVRQILQGRQPRQAGKPEPETRPTPLRAVVAPEKSDGSVSKVAALMDEQSFMSFLGVRDDIDPTVPEQAAAVRYDPKDFLQGSFESACALAISHQQALRVETPWKPLVVFPQIRRIWINADEAQLRAACAIRINNLAHMDISGPRAQTAKDLKVTPIDAGQAELDPSRMISLDAFLWKMAIWTSKGKIPVDISFEHEVALKHWPNLTRFLLIPHTMRIAALLYHSPHTVCEAAQILGIRQQYVFAFISAAHALRLIEQRPKQQTARAEIQASTARPEPERTSFLGKILKHLKMS